MIKKSELTVAEARDQRQRLLGELHSAQHHEQVETTYYGSYNPYDVPLVDCDTCGISPKLEKSGPFNNRWNVACSKCKKQIQHPQFFDWKAKLLWWQRNLIGHNYQRFPLFDLCDLDVPAARRRVSGIRRDLEIKRGLAEADDVLCRIIPEITPPGVEYMQRLDAYMGWAMVVLAQLKLKDGGTQRLKRLEYLANKNTV